MNFQTLLQNKHTTIAGAVYIGSKLVAQLVNVWCPGHEVQVKSSLDVIEGAAVTWGLIMAGDAKQGQKQTDALSNQVKSAIETGNTEQLKKPTP